VILATTKPGDTILDPFFGTGTTGAVAKKLGRHFIGIERDKTYIAAAKKRIAAIGAPKEDDLAITRSKKEEPRVPFGQVLEAGFLRPGDTLMSPDRKHKAKVRADGSLIASGATGSIHRIGAHVTRAPACNGWTFWHFEGEGGLQPIDHFRRQIRSAMAV
jgi:modification methylase